MDEKGYTFTPLAFLLMIPVIIVAIAFTGIVNDLNNIAQLAIGGDVTYTAAQNIIVAVEKGAQDSGRNGSYNATKVVIDNEASRMTNPFFASGGSRTFIAGKIADGINDNVVKTSLKLESETGRDIFINNVKIDSYTDKPFNANQISITQTEPFSFNVNIPQGINITVAQKGQNSTLIIPQNAIKVTVSIEGLEDPYIWVKSKDRRSDNIYKYPYYSYIPNLNQKEYHFDDMVQGNTIQNLAMCLNGTNNPSGITPRPYYFPDNGGLTFFDRLEGRDVSTDTASARMTTFILGNPLYEEPGYFNNTYNMSSVDHEYFTKIPGNETIKVNGNVIIDPWNSYYAGPPVPFCLSYNYRKTVFNLKLTYP
jgi:hypothetical protein